MEEMRAYGQRGSGKGALRELFRAYMHRVGEKGHLFRAYGHRAGEKGAFVE